jgi:hypothetical protein
MEKVTVEVNPTCAKIARSPLYFIITALYGVSVSFAPLFLYWCGKGGYFQGFESAIAPVCFAMIVLVPLLPVVLGSAVIRQLRRK